MAASVGDRIVVPGRKVGAAERIGSVIEVRGRDGSPPYVIQWEDGHKGMFFPGPEARVQPPR